jgi:hypothetical protein
MNDPDWTFPGLLSAKELADPVFKLLDGIETRKSRLPSPLPWIEPSINMPYLQACKCYLFHCPLPSMLALGSTLEHCLRIAVIDRYESRQGAVNKAQWDRFKTYSIGDFLMESGEKRPKSFDSVLRLHIEGIIELKDREWWKETSKQLRNKTAHFDIPDLIMNAGRREDWVGDYKDTDDPGRVFNNRFWWGAPFHVSDDLIAAAFLEKATCQLKRLIVKMDWKADTSYWASQKSAYEEFFRFSWRRESMAESMLLLQAYWSRKIL